MLWELSVCSSDVARKGHGGNSTAPKLPSCPPKQINLKFFLTSFANNVRPECHNWGYKPKHCLLAPLAALFCTLIFIVVALSVIAMVS